VPGNCVSDDPAQLVALERLLQIGAMSIRGHNPLKGLAVSCRNAGSARLLATTKKLAIAVTIVQSQRRLPTSFQPVSSMLQPSCCWTAV
jgi:hypothetical protein